MRAPRRVPILCPDCGGRLGACLDAVGDDDRRVYLRERQCPDCGARWMLVETLFPASRQAEERRRLRSLRAAARRAFAGRPRAYAEG